MNMRKITSMTMLMSLIVLIINSVVLYIVPEGRVAYWADWKFLGLTKGQWGEQHTTVGVLFLIAGFLHIYYNWSPIMAYMKNKAKEFKFFTANNNVAMAVTAIFVVGTIYNVPPMSTIIHISEGIKNDASITYGEPPYGHAELSSLKMFCKRENLDLKKSMELLKQAGFSVSGEKELIKNIAKSNNVSPKIVYDTIKPAAKSKAAASAGGNVGGFPEAPKSGLGKKSLNHLCQEYGVNVHKVIEGLKSAGIEAQAEQTIKEIGASVDKAPAEVYEIIYEVTSKGK